MQDTNHEGIPAGQSSLLPQHLHPTRQDQHPQHQLLPSSSQHGCSLRHISRSNPVFQRLDRLAPASSLQDGLVLLPDSSFPQHKLFPSCPAAGTTPWAGAAAPFSSPGCLRELLEQCDSAVPSPGLPRRCDSGLAALARLSLQQEHKQAPAGPAPVFVCRGCAGVMPRRVGCALAPSWLCSHPAKANLAGCGREWDLPWDRAGRQDWLLLQQSRALCNPTAKLLLTEQG